MRIIDKNTDFYDYLQNVYRDDSLTFVRTDSFLLTKDDMCKHLAACRYTGGRFHFCLLQVCNTLWLFLIEVVETLEDDERFPTKFDVDLLATWSNFAKERVLCDLSIIHFDWTLTRHFRIDLFPKMQNGRAVYNYCKQSIKDEPSLLIDAINTNNYDVDRCINSYNTPPEVVRRRSFRSKADVEMPKYIPLFKASGFSSHIDPQEIYLAFEAYFSAERTASERTESKGLTDKEKIENHGFDVKKSFRGK